MAKIVGRCDLCGEVIYNSEPKSIKLGKCVYCINNKNDTFERYGQTWYYSRLDAEKHRQPPDTIVYDKGMSAYYIKQKKSIWNF